MTNKAWEIVRAVPWYVWLVLPVAYFLVLKFGLLLGAGFLIIGYYVWVRVVRPVVG